MNREEFWFLVKFILGGLFLILLLIAIGSFIEAWINLWKLRETMNILKDSGVDIETIRSLVESFKPFGAL